VELIGLEWDQGNEHFPPTSFQISNLQAGTGAENIIPGDLSIMFNLRYSTELSEQKIRDRIHAILDKYRLDYTLDWRLSGKPFLTPAGELVDAARDAIREVIGIETTLSTSGGTSDGRFIAPTGAQVLELGPINATIHQVNECVAVTALDELSAIYRRILEKLLS
jgi:succinyl-diaminopimelate desuccinylase